MQYRNVKLNQVEMSKTTSGQNFARGTILLPEDKSIKEFKLWSDSNPEGFVQLFTDNVKYLKIGYEESTYNGTVYFTIKEYSQLTDEEIFESFHKADAEFRESILTRLHEGILKPRLSEKGYTFLREFFKVNRDLYNRFTVEQAAVKMHDARPSGLLHHTTKMLELLALVMDQHNNFNLTREGQDLVYIGLLIHDIGKTLEYQDGEVTKLAKVTHRGLGIEIAVLNKDLFLKYYPEDFYYEIIAIINQHHGVFEEKPHSVFSYLVHLIDMADTHISGLEESIKTNKDSDSLRVIDREIPKLMKEKHYFDFGETNE